MRRTMEVLAAFEATVERYIMELDSLGLEQLRSKPDEETWSIGQMYVHLIQSAQYLHLQYVDQCLASGEETWMPMGQKTEQGKAVFESGSFPPIQIRVPASPQYTPRQPENKEQLLEGLRSVVERMKHTEPGLIQALEEHKIVHPSLGALHAQEWFLLIEMHYRHHLLQLARLQEFLQSNAQQDALH
ncbi:DinB superfamily protein [compost metagenome]